MVLGNFNALLHITLHKRIFFLPSRDLGEKNVGREKKNSFNKKDQEIVELEKINYVSFFIISGASNTAQYYLWELFLWN